MLISKQFMVMVAVITINYNDKQLPLYQKSQCHFEGKS